MRYSKEHKSETHARIVKKASVRLREKGAHGVGVAELMKEAGLTHGGFYAHFDSREALLVEAFSYAMDRSAARWSKLIEALPAEQRFQALIDNYLTTAHRDDPGQGCAVPTLGPEIGREGARTRKAFAAGVERMIDFIAAQIEAEPDKEARQQAMATLSTMIGSLVLARITGTGTLSDNILAAGRETAVSLKPRSRARRSKIASKPTTSA